MKAELVKKLLSNERVFLYWQASKSIFCKTSAVFVKNFITFGILIFTKKNPKFWVNVDRRCILVSPHTSRIYIAASKSKPKMNLVVLHSPLKNPVWFESTVAYARLYTKIHALNKNWDHFRNFRKSTKVENFNKSN